MLGNAALNEFSVTVDGNVGYAYGTNFTLAELFQANESLLGMSGNTE